MPGSAKKRIYSALTDQELEAASDSRLKTEIDRMKAIQSLASQEVHRLSRERKRRQRLKTELHRLLTNAP